MPDLSAIVADFDATTPSISTPPHSLSPKELRKRKRALSQTIQVPESPKRPRAYTAEVQDLLLWEICIVLDVPPSSLDQEVSFVQMGGQSLAAALLSSACTRRGLHLSVEAILRSKSISELVNCITTISPLSSSGDAVTSRTLCDCSTKHIAEIEPLVVSKAATRMDVAQESCTSLPSKWIPSPMTAKQSSMTEMQLSLIHGSQVTPGTNIICFLESYMSENLPLIKNAWKAVIDLEPIFRTAFEFNDGKGNLSIQSKAPFHWTEIVTNSQETYQQELEEGKLQPLIGTSFHVVKFDKGSKGLNVSTIIWRVHHALIDGYSASLIHKKVQQVAAGRTVQPGTNFTEVAIELQALQKSTSSTSKIFWEQEQAKYRSAVGELLLPPLSTRHSSDGNTTKSVTLQVPIDEVTIHAQRLGVSLAAVYYGAWALALSKYTDSDNVVFGIVLSGRNLPLKGVEDTIGPLINTLPFYVSVNKVTRAAEYLRHIFSRMIELGSIQFSLPEDGYSRQFSSAVAMEFEMDSSTSSSVQPVGDSFFETTSDIPLSVFLGAGGKLRLCYHCKTYNAIDIEILAKHYRNSILALLSPDSAVATCMEESLPEDCRETLFKMGNCISDTTSPSSIHDDLVTLFERSVTQHPDVIAIERNSHQLTYGEFNAMAGRVSQYLSQHIKPGEVVCVHADRSINWIIAIYGILKAGGVYASLDLDLPSQLRNSNFQTAGSKIFLTPGSYEKTFMPRSCTMCISVEDIISEPCTTASLALAVVQRPFPRPEASAYICFTSGSTGKPKAVVCSHEGLVAFQKELEVRLCAKPGCRISQTMSPAFDGSIHEIFSALSYGATLVLGSNESPFSHLDMVESAILTPSIAKVLAPEDFPRLQNVYLVGEPVSQYVNDCWAADKRLYNMYGPTEGTCGATIKRLYPGVPVNIGHPNSSTRVYILDRYQCLTPQGVVGEIYLAGVQIARGYLNRPEETARRFLNDSILHNRKEQMHRTGDRGYWNFSGEIVCLGRNDRQIKLRGFRLDLNDLEIRIACAVPEATAVAVAQKSDYLVAMVQPGSLDAANIKSRIAQVLTVHSVPRYIAAVDTFPLTAAGKTDYSAIAANVKTSFALVAASLKTSSEKIIADAWREALEIGHEVAITRDSMFVALGGHSTLQLLLASRLTALFKRQIPFSLIAQSPTLHNLAKAIDNLQPQKAPVSDELRELVLGEHGVSAIEHEWWSKYNLGVGSSAFTVSFVCALEHEIVNLEKLESAWNVVIARHRILSSRYVMNERHGLKRMYSDDTPRVHRVKSLNIAKELSRPFYLDKNDLIRVIISPNRMVVCISHIVCDLTTLQVLLQEVSSIYRGACLSPIKRIYSEVSHFNTPATPKALAFWTTYLASPPSIPFGTIPLSPRLTYAGYSSIRTLPTSLFSAFKSFTQVHAFTSHQVALAAVALALQADSENMDIVLGSPYLNRGYEDLETVGLFLEPLPIRINYTPSSSPQEATSAFIRSVQASSQAALSHAVPWNQLLKHLKVKPSFPDHPLFEVMVTVHDATLGPKFAVEGCEQLGTWADGSKFRVMCEFSMQAESLSLRVECEDKVEGNKVARAVVKALQCLVDGVRWNVARERVRALAEN